MAEHRFPRPEDTELRERVVLRTVRSADRSNPAGASTVNVSADAEFDFGTSAGVIGDGSATGVPVLLEAAGGAGAHEFNSTAGRPAPASDPRVYQLKVFDSATGDELQDPNGRPVWAVITAVARNLVGPYTLRYFCGEYGSGNEAAGTVFNGHVLAYHRGFLLESIPYTALVERPAIVGIVAGGNRPLAYLSTKFNPLWNYQFNRTFADTGGSAGVGPLVQVAGTTRFRQIGGIWGWFAGVIDRLELDHAAFAQLGAFTLCFINSVHNFQATRTIITHELAPLGAEANNIAYRVRHNTNGSPLYTHQHNAGVSADYNVLDRCGTFPGLYGYYVTRTAGGVIQHGFNGRPIGAPSGALTMPTGSTSGRLCVGQNQDGTGGFVGDLASLQGYDRVLTNDELAHLFAEAGLYSVP